MAGARHSARWWAGRLTIGTLSGVFACAVYSWITLPDVRGLADRAPERTAFMTLRANEARAAGRSVREDHRWIPYSRISRNLTRAVLVAEDAGFWGHDGVDYRELRVSLETSMENRTVPRGASTLTQQLAKNLYLSPSRNPWRKVEELMITRRLEAELSKTRIFELYLNVVEWGDGIWGAEAASRAYFGTSASGLSPAQAALMAGALINARVYSPARPNARLLARQRLILSRMARGGAGAAVPAPTTPDEPTPLPSVSSPAPDVPAAPETESDERGDQSPGGTP